MRPSSGKGIVKGNSPFNPETLEPLNQFKIYFTAEGVDAEDFGANGIAEAEGAAGAAAFE